MTRFNHRQFIVNELIERNGNLCAVCGEEFKVYAPPTIDHKKPLIADGPSSFENLQLVHSICNQRKGIKPHKADKTSQHRAKKKLAQDAIKAHKGVMDDAAKSLNISTRTLYRWI